MKIQAACKKATNELLWEMAADGYYAKNRQYLKTGDPDFVPPTPWDINNGYCDQWAVRVAELVGDEADGDFSFEDEMTGCDHYMVEYRSRYYDAECHAGVADPSELPIYAYNRKVLGITNSL